MSKRFKINSLIICVLAILFLAFFQITKHSPGISSANPFADDPYDAIGSFGIETAVFLSMVCLVRAFRRYRTRSATDEQQILLARTQVATILAVGVPLAGDAVAMSRHMSKWYFTSGGMQLGALLIGMILATTLAAIFLYRSIRVLHLPEAPNRSRKAILVLLAFFVILFLYPENLIASTMGSLFTVLTGATLLFMLVWGICTAWLPQTEAFEHKRRVSPWLWGIVVLVGAVAGLLIVLREISSEGSAANLVGSMFIISIYMGLEICALLIGYAFLGKALGLVLGNNKVSK